MKIGVIVPCTDSKAGGGLQAAVRDLDEGLTTMAAAERWIALLDASKPLSSARNLYKGPGWAASLRLVATVQEVGAEVEWRIMSAGYGLLQPDAQVTRYSATFAVGQSDSVPGSARLVDAPGVWWAEINRRRGQDKPLIRLASEVDGLVVAASAPYVAAISAELLVVSKQVPTVVFCAGRPRDAEVAALAPRFDRRLREGVDPFVRGGDVGFNQRVATRVVEVLGTAAVDRGRVDEVLAEAMDREGPVRHGRQVANDAMVMAFIEAALMSDPSVSRTALLRRWREGGRACEQRRFGVLYERVVAERDGQLTLGEATCG